MKPTCRFCFTSLTTLTSGTGVTRDVLRKMNPKQVANLLRTNGASDKTLLIFEQNDILNGETITGEITEDDLKEIGFATVLQRKGIKNIIKLCIADEGHYYLWFFVTILIIVI